MVLQLGSVGRGTAAERAAYGLQRAVVSLMRLDIIAIKQAAAAVLAGELRVLASVE